MAQRPRVRMPGSMATGGRGPAPPPPLAPQPTPSPGAPWMQAIQRSYAWMWVCAKCQIPSVSPGCGVAMGLATHCGLRDHLKNSHTSCWKGCPAWRKGLSGVPSTDACSSSEPADVPPMTAPEMPLYEHNIFGHAPVLCKFQSGKAVWHLSRALAPTPPRTARSDTPVPAHNHLVSRVLRVVSH